MAKEKIKRIFNIKDASLIQWTRKIHALLILYLTDFKAYDLMFDAGYATDYKTKIDDAEALPDDPIVVAQQKQITVQVEGYMSNGRNEFQHLKRFVKKTFPNNPAIWDEFGFSRYDDARDSQSKMILFYRDLHVTAEKYKVQLIAQNYTQVMIDELQTIYSQLSGTDSSQEIKKETRTEETQTRVIAYNELYTIGVDICESGQYIFRNNPARHNMFIIPSERDVKDIFTNNISAGETQTVVEKQFKANDKIQCDNLGTNDWKIGLMLTSGEVVITGVTVPAGTSVEVLASELGDVETNRFLNITNSDTSDGSYSITV